MGQEREGRSLAPEVSWGRGKLLKRGSREAIPLGVSWGPWTLQLGGPAYLVLLLALFLHRLR